LLPAIFVGFVWFLNQFGKVVIFSSSATIEEETSLIVTSDVVDVGPPLLRRLSRHDLGQKCAMVMRNMQVSAIWDAK
jgi:hypothetical protein